jgi:hypothetical protein
VARTLRLEVSRIGEFVFRPLAFGPLLLCLAMGLSLWFANHGLPVNDEGAVLSLAGRISRGSVFYRDLDAYYFPGSLYLLAGWMQLVGEHVNAARWLAAAFFSGLLVGLYWIAVQLLDHRRAAIFGVGLLSFKFLASPAFTSYMYSDVSLCFAVYAIALFLRHRHGSSSIPLVGSGVLVALSIACKQSLGLTVAMAASMLLVLSPELLGTPRRDFRARFRELGAFWFGLLAATAPMLGYFVAKGVFGQLVHSGLLRPFLSYLPTSGIPFTKPLAWWNLGELQGMPGFPFFIAPYWSMLMNGGLPAEPLYPAYWMTGEIFSRALYTSVPVVFIAIFWRWARGIRTGHFSDAERRLFAFASLALAVFLSAFPRADLFHVLSVYPVVFLLLFALKMPLHEEADARGTRNDAPWLAACAVALLLAVTGSLAIAHQARHTHHMKLARADLYIEPGHAWLEPIVEYIDETLEPDEQIFVYGHEAYYYFLTARYYPWPFVQIYPGQVGGDRGVRLARSLAKRPPAIIVRGMMDWPGVPKISSYAKALSAFVAGNYAMDPSFFVNHPPPVGATPPDWAISLLRHRAPRTGAELPRSASP